MLKGRSTQDSSSMAVASDALPHFSLLCGASSASARALTAQIEDRVVRCLRGDFTWEAWVQIRTAKGRKATPDRHGCWWVHSPSWTCGATSDLRVVIFDDGDWYISDVSPTRPLQSRRWHHVAVCGRRQERSRELFVDGEAVPLGVLQDPEGLRLPVAPSAGFRLGWTPIVESPCEFLLHEVRLWSTCLSKDIVQRWMDVSVSTEHPNTTHLFAYWSFNNGSLTPPEIDLSGHGHDLIVENTRWLPATPPGFHRSQASDVARLVCYQETDTATTREETHFVVELDATPQLDMSYAFQAVTVVLMLNFPCYPGPSLTSPEQGTGFKRSLQDLVRRLPSGFSLVVYNASGFQDGSNQPIVVCDILDEHAKTRACRALDRVVIKKPVNSSGLLSCIVRSVQDLEATHHHSYETNLFVCAVIAVTTVVPVEARKELISAADSLQGSYSSVTMHIIEVGAASSSSSSFLEDAKMSCLFTLYASCENDFEWVLAVIFCQLQELILIRAELIFEATGTANFILTEESQPVFHRYIGNEPQSRLVIPLGSFAYSCRLQLSGIANFAAKSLQDRSHIEVILTYFTRGGRRHVSYVSLRQRNDTTNHLYIEYSLRNKRLQINDRDVQLLEQRRALMRRKLTFVNDFVSHEVAEAENAFKKVNIMKEELWAKRKWLVSRGSRLFDEMELQRLSDEAISARSAFTTRTESLQSTFAAISRGLDSRGSNRSKNNLGSTSLRVRLEETSRPDRGLGGSDDEEQQSDEQKLQKVCVKLSVQSKLLNEHEAKMEDLFVSLRLAEAKGPVIMNDTRRSWALRYRDMICTKKAVIDATLAKDMLEWTIEFHEAREVTRQEVDAEAQSTNAALVRFEKELGKRRKRALLCAKEIVGSVIDEFEASQRLEAARRDTTRCQLMKTLSLTQDMLAACIYVSFPIEISQQEVPTRSSARGFANLVHGVCAGLRQFCDADSETPVCRRLAFGETFLWWGLEQQINTEGESTMTANRDVRRVAQSKAWAFLIVSYNSLFSSATAIAEVRDVLVIARDQAKPVFHIQLERPFDGLEDFRSKWTSRIQTEKTNMTAPPTVEREFLMWRQNITSFQALIGSVAVVETVELPPLLDIYRCEHSDNALPGDVSWRYPCLECLWPLLGSSRQVVAPPVSSYSHSDGWFLRLVFQIGGWVDTTDSVSLQTAPRSYHIDPNAISVISREWEAYQHDTIRQLTTNWNDACVRRTKEIQRQIGKLFKVYEEEARDYVALQFKLHKRKEEILGGMNTQLSNLLDERKLLETWLEKLWLDEAGTDHGRRGKEIEWMLSEELWQRMNHADAATLYLETLEDRVDTPSDEEITAAKLQLDSALRHSSRAILDLGRSHIGDTFRSLMRGFKVRELTNQIKIANANCDEQRDQIARMESIFEQAENIMREMRDQRDVFVTEDATAFFNASRLEISFPPSTTTHDVDQQQLRKLAGDLDFLATLSASIMSQVLQAQLASSTAVDYRAKLNDVITSFLDVYSPSIGDLATLDDPCRAAQASFKDFCQFTPEDPGKTYASLLSMREFIDAEALDDREVQRVLGEWKLRFIDVLLAAHTQRWWEHCRGLLRHARAQLNNVKSSLDRSFELRVASECEFREAVANREKFGHRLALLQRRLVETRQRQQSLLLLLQICRKCYETASGVMNEKLQNVKTDVMFKKWSSILEYHVELIGKLFDCRSQCSEQLDALEADINSCQSSLSLCDGIIDSKRQAWIKHSIADNMACTKSDGHQQLAHRTIDLIVCLERQRVFKLFRVLDPRGLWLTIPVLTEWHDGYIREYQRDEALRKAGGKQLAVGRNGVDDLLVQLSIARLDVIKQEKLRDALRRKISVLERIHDEQVELRNIVESEARLYHSLGSQMAERVLFLRDQYDASGQSEYLQLEQEGAAIAASSIDRHSAVQAVRASHDVIAVMIKSAQQDYLRVEATTCQIAWRMREHIACGCRGERAIEKVQSELIHVERYLQVLKTKDSELFELSLQSEKPGSTKATNDTHSMGVDVATGRAVFNFYARDQWFRSCLGETTTLGERIKFLREVLVSLTDVKQLSIEQNTGGDDRISSDSVRSDDGGAGEGGAVGEDEQLVVLQNELRRAELALLLNRFESRRAEKTSEDLRAAITNRFEPDKAGEVHLLNEDATAQRDVDVVLSAAKLHSRMFCVGTYRTERERMLVLLRELATRFDPRDVAGNLSEVIFGASLDRNDLRDIFLLQSKAHVDEQWRVAFVVLFFARLFRRASLKKAVAVRQAQASVLTREKLQVLRNYRYMGRILVAPQGLHRMSHTTLLPTESATNQIHDFLQSVEIDIEGEKGSSLGHLERLALGIVMQQPLHRVLARLMPDGTKTICQVADEMEQRRAVAEHRPPKPTLLHVVLRDRHSIKIEWKPIATDHDLVYVAEISEHEPNRNTADGPSSARYWTQFLTTEKTSHTFYNLHPGYMYWVRVRSGFSLTRLGLPCIPILASTLL